MASLWYVLRSKPHMEAVVADRARAQGAEVFYPCIRVQPVNPRSRKVRPYFPGYLFVRGDLETLSLSSFQWMPNAIGLVAFGGIPAPVPDEVVEAIRQHVERVSAAGGEQLFGLRPGDEVLVQNGPFAGYEAIFDTRLSGSDRVRVLLKMLNDRYAPVVLPAGQIKRKR